LINAQIRNGRGYDHDHPGATVAVVVEGLAVAPSGTRVEGVSTGNCIYDMCLPRRFLLHDSGPNPQFPYLVREWLQPSQSHSIFLSGDENIDAVLLGDQDQSLDLRWRIWMMVGKRHEGHDLSSESLQGQAKMVRRSNAAKCQETPACEGCEWQDLTIGQDTEVQRRVLAAKQGKT
jgi:hypothetical protein